MKNRKIKNVRALLYSTLGVVSRKGRNVVKTDIETENCENRFKKTNYSKDEKPKPNKYIKQVKR